MEQTTTTDIAIESSAAPPMKQEWEPTRVCETVEKAVNLTDAPNITWRGGPCRPYAIRFRFERYGGKGGPWRSYITIYAMRPGGIVGNWFSPSAVYMPPEWLTDLIAAATPADTASRDNKEQGKAQP